MIRMFGLVIIILFLFSSCEKDDPVVLSSQGGFPQEPVNFSICNSAYDDYNSDIIHYPGDCDFLSFVFSSNRTSKGKDFDFMIYSLSLSYPIDNDVVTIKEFDGKSNQGAYLDYHMPSVNTEYNEFGPYLMNYRFNNNTSEEYIFFYTQEINNRCRLKFYKLEITPHDFSYTPYEINILNSENYNVGYLTIQNNRMYYNCDMDGNYDIYELAIDTTMNIVDFLTQHRNLQSEAKKIVESDQDDKCPFVVNDFLVFTSKREGGQGGFDLWYSKLNDNSWSDPVNLGDKVNSMNDEYRPFVVKYKNIPNDLMIFSSNRSGGFGGFDLYYTGITQTRN